MVVRLSCAVALVAACSDPTKPAPVDWPMYGLDVHHSFATTHTSIDAKNATRLKMAWSFPTGDAVSASPTIVGGVVYAGSWDGNFYALDVETGAVRWSFGADCQNAIAPVPARCLAPGETAPDRMGTDGGLITSTAAVDGGRVYFASGRTLYALDAATGSVAWKQLVCGNPDEPSCETNVSDPNHIFSSPVVFDGRVIVGASPDGADGYRGAIVAFDAANGAQLWRFETDPMLDASGNVIGAYNRGCGSVWGSGAIDEDARLVFFGTGDCQGGATAPYHEAVLALEVDTGKVRWSYRPRMTDSCDLDFGASANVIDAQGTRYVGLGGKDGTYYLLDAHTGMLAWSKNVVAGGASGGFIGSSAFDGTNVFGATGLGELGAAMPCNPNDPRDTDLQDPSFHALAIADGSVAWEQPMAYSFAATTIANGLVLNGVGNAVLPALALYDKSTGDKLGKLAADGAVNSGATIYGDFVVFGSGNSFDGSGGAIVAYELR